MDFTLTAEDQQLVDRAADLAREFSTRAKIYDEESAFPIEDFKQLREEGFLSLAVPAELGGHGLWQGSRYLPYYMILEAISAGNASTAQLLQIQTHATGIISYLGSDEQRSRFLGDVVENGALIASCGSETNPHLFESENSRAELQPVEGGFKLNAVKHFGSLSPAAEYYVVYVMAPGAKSAAEGYTSIVVPKDSPGVSLTDNWDVMGMRATISWSLILEDVFVPWEDVLGQPGDWVQFDPRTFTLAYVANHLGTAQGVYNYVLEYLQQRPFLLNDNVNAYIVGEMSAALQSTRTSLWYAASLWERGCYEEAELASMRVLHTSKQTALMVTSKAFDVLGARAAFRHLPIERAFRDVRTFSLHFRESTVLRMLIEAELGGDFHSKQKYGPAVGRQSWDSLGFDWDN